MHSSVQHPVIPSFRILCDLFAKEQGSFLSHHTVVYCVFCRFVFCMVTDFSAAEKGRSMKFCMRVGLLSTPDRSSPLW